MENNRLITAAVVTTGEKSDGKLAVRKARQGKKNQNNNNQVTT